MVWRAILVGVLALLSIVAGSSAFAQTPAFDWRSDWAVAEGFTIVEDTTGYQFPSAIAFVPEPDLIRKTRSILSPSCAGRSKWSRTIAASTPLLRMSFSLSLPKSCHQAKVKAVWAAFALIRPAATCL